MSNCGRRRCPSRRGGRCRLRSATRRGRASSSGQAGRSGRYIPPRCRRRDAARIPSGTRSPPDACAAARRICLRSPPDAQAPRPSTSADWPAPTGSSRGSCSGAARACPRTARCSRRAKAGTDRTSAASARAAPAAGLRRTSHRPDTPGGSGRAPRTEYDTRMPTSSYARITSSARPSTSASLPGIQPWMCCTVVMPEAIISNAEYSVSRYMFRFRATMRVTNHSSSGMSGEPSCTGVSPTWW